mmetsp:Transcript_21329/g.35170  ORF Transcript_21329/g.35170 Transcript_21329/m.35170 type:complete len:637 (-) Transcript_21329:199-2109(-)
MTVLGRQFPVPVRGMNYQPDPSDYSQNRGPPKIYYDSDYYHDDFTALWGALADGHGRQDLKLMAKAMNVNFIRLYNWNPEHDHLSFLRECARLGLSVAVPISNYFLGCVFAEIDCATASPGSWGCNEARAQCGGKVDVLFEAVVNETRQVPNAVAAWTVGNEVDIAASGSCDVPRGCISGKSIEVKLRVISEAVRKLLIAESKADWPAHMLPAITVPTSVVKGGTLCPNMNAGFLCDLHIKLNQDHPHAIPRFIGSFQTYDTGEWITEFVRKTAPTGLNRIGLGSLPLIITEMNHQQGSEMLDEASISARMTACLDQPGRLLGCFWFQLLDKPWYKTNTAGGCKTCSGFNEAGMGIYRLTGPTQIVETTSGKYWDSEANQPATYLIDTIVAKQPLQQIIQEAYGKHAFLNGGVPPAPTPLPAPSPPLPINPPQLIASLPRAPLPPQILLSSPLPPLPFPSEHTQVGQEDAEQQGPPEQAELKGADQSSKLSLVSASHHTRHHKHHQPPVAGATEMFENAGRGSTAGVALVAAIFGAIFALVLAWLLGRHKATFSQVRHEGADEQECGDDADSAGEVSVERAKMPTQSEGLKKGRKNLIDLKARLLAERHAGKSDVSLTATEQLEVHHAEGGQNHLT